MTNGWVDMKNTDMMLIMGGNPAENHPCGFKWPIEAKRTRGARMISVDPRFTRTSAVSVLFFPIPPRPDNSFLRGVIFYSIQNNPPPQNYPVNFPKPRCLLPNTFKRPRATP